MAGTFILDPYVRRRSPGLFRRIVAMFGLVSLAAFYGLMVSVLPPQLLAIPGLPIVILVALVLWMLPDVGGVQDARMHKLMVWYLALNALWPSYVAVNVPGLPWITPTRITVFILLGVVVFNLATSAELRSRAMTVLGGAPVFKRLFWTFWAITTFSIVFSNSPFFSLNKYINNQIFWTMMFVFSAFLATRPGFVSQVGRTLTWTAAIVALIGIYEFKRKGVIWLDHLPPFLKVDPDFLDNVARAASRPGTDVYRVKGTTANSLFLAEYLAMVLPLFLHFGLRAKGMLNKALLAAGFLGVAVTMYLTNARSGIIGVMLTLVVYMFFAGWRERKQNPTSILATTIVFAYPVAIAVLAGLVLFWQRLHVLLLGGRLQASSTEARAEQWHDGLPLVFTHPFGHGVGRAAETLNYTNAAGVLTIDSYYLSLLLDYGFLGLMVFSAMFLLPGWIGFRAFSEARGEDAEMVGPLAVGLLNFAVIKAVSSAEVNMPLAFIMLGCIVGLLWTVRQEQAAARSVAQPGPMPA